MGKAEILAELPNLSADDRAEVQAKLDELAGDEWVENADLSDADKRAIDEALDNLEKFPGAGIPWEEAKARIEARLRS